MFDKKLMKTRYPDLQEAYHNAGQFYWGKADAFLQNLLIYSHHASAHLMPRYRVQDIDTEGDGKQQNFYLARCRIEDCKGGQFCYGAVPRGYCRVHKNKPHHALPDVG